MNNLESNFACSICLNEYCKDAVECVTCHNIFCKICTISLDNKKCPLCRKLTEFIDSHFARRLINSLQTECEDCRQKLTIGEINKHKEICVETVLQCSLCNERYRKCDYLSHLTASRLLQIIDKLSSINSIIAEKEATLVRFSIDTQINQYSQTIAKLGETGKYYCGGRLDFVCNCCNGSCGPDNGCNCSGCMELDIKSRGLPKGWLVNREGYASKKSIENGRFYCGRKVISSSHNCGSPSLLSFNCASCKKLDSQSNAGYSRLI